MKIAFDAKRAFHNARGLGNYSRDTIRLLGSYYPENSYFLFNPSSKNSIRFPLTDQTKVVYPQSLAGKIFKSIWRSGGMCRQIRSIKPDIYHGLSQELPRGIESTGVKSVVTMHDVIFMRYPELYSATYRSIFIKKNKHACRFADRIITISEQTKRDLIKYFAADEQKISVVYQGCNAIFRQPVSTDKKEYVQKKYHLPPHFLLNVGAIEKRKNAALIVEALHQKQLGIPLVIVGKPTSYVQEIRLLISKYQMEDQVLFIHDAETSDLPAIYALSEIFIYPSIFEGFGIPILEALCTGTPVISSTGSCFEETGGPFSLYINPESPEELGESISRVLSDSDLKNTMIKEGLAFSEKFSDQTIAQDLMDVYQSLLNS